MFHVEHFVGVFSYVCFYPYLRFDKHTNERNLLSGLRFLYIRDWFRGYCPEEDLCRFLILLLSFCWVPAP